MSSSIPSLDAHIARLEQELVNLKRKRNALTRIYTIPAEILAEIILHVFKALTPINFVDDWSEEGCGVNVQMDWSWIALMLVCYQFRCVALGCPELWSIIDFRPESRRWARLCISRSTNPSVTILLASLGVDSIMDAEIANALQICSSAYIDMKVPDGTLGGQPWNQTLASLSRLYLHADRYARYRTNLSISTEFMGGNATALTHLTLQAQGKLFIEDLPELTSLQYLKLRHLVSDSHGNVLRRLSKKAPRLARLVMVFVSCANDSLMDAIARDAENIHLFPNLKCLTWLGSSGLPLLAMILHKPPSNPFHLVIDQYGPAYGIFQTMYRLITQYEASYMSVSPSRTWSLHISSLVQTGWIMQHKVLHGPPQSHFRVRFQTDLPTQKRACLPMFTLSIFNYLQSSAPSAPVGDICSAVPMFLI